MYSGIINLLYFSLLQYRLRELENSVLRKTRGLERDEVTGSWGRLHIGKFHGLHSSPKIIQVIEPRRMRWIGYATLMEEKSGVQSFVLET